MRLEPTKTVGGTSVYGAQRRRQESLRDGVLTSLHASKVLPFGLCNTGLLGLGCEPRPRAGASHWAGEEQARSTFGVRKEFGSVFQSSWKNWLKLGFV